MLLLAASDHVGAFSLWTQFTVPTGKKVDTREECHWPHAFSLQPEPSRETQCITLVSISVGKKECQCRSATGAIRYVADRC
jgi:hypothetical protein